MAFGKKNKTNNVGVNKSEIGVKYNIRISTPNGYFPEDADRIIQGLEKQIENLEKENKILTTNYEQSSSDLNKLKAEYQKLQFEMLQLSVNTSDYQAYNQMESLMKINPAVGDLPEVDTDFKKYEEPPLIDIVEDVGKANFDEMVTSTTTKTEEPPKEKPIQNISIFNEDGSLDII